MTDYVHTGLRLSRAMLDRADTLIPELARDDRVAAMGTISQSAVLRLAILKGLKVLEKELDDHDAKD